jgi:hypothetical protein
MTTTAGETRTGRSRKTAASTRRSTSRESGSSSTKKATTSGQERTRASGKGRARTSAKTEQAPRTARLNLPGMSAEFRRPDLPSPRDVARAASAAPRQVARAASAAPRGVARAAGAATTVLPPRDQLLYYGGLGVAAVAGVIEWPVAVAVGAGLAIARRSRQEDTKQGDRRRTESSES